MKTTSILFVCMGNICRSPMAEGIFKAILKREHCEHEFLVDSAGTLGYHAGESPDSRMCAHASRRGYFLQHRSRKITRNDFGNFDLLVVMDDENYDDVSVMAQTKEEQSKIIRMTDYCTRHKATHIPDPYYGGSAGFEHVIDLLEDACEELFKQARAY